MKSKTQKKEVKKMRHKKGIKKLSKPTDQRIALLRSLTISIIKYNKVTTSRARAKAVRGFVERIIALSKKGGLANLRRALAIVPQKKLITEFFKIAPERFADKNGGAVRLTNVGLRRGDASEMVLIELL